MSGNMLCGRKFEISVEAVRFDFPALSEEPSSVDLHLRGDLLVHEECESGDIGDGVEDHGVI